MLCFFAKLQEGERKQALHCWKGVHLACCLCCEFLMAAFQLAVPALSRGRGSCVQYWQSRKPLKLLAEMDIPEAEKGIMLKQKEGI